jgi:translation initiation factor 3 subunit B
MFVEFANAEQASLAVKLIDGYKMDKSHTLAVNRFTDVEKYSNVEEEFHAPPEEEFVEKVYSHLPLKRHVSSTKATQFC